MTGADSDVTAGATGLSTVCGDSFRCRSMWNEVYGQSGQHVFQATMVCTAEVGNGASVLESRAARAFPAYPKLAQRQLYVVLHLA